MYFVAILFCGHFSLLSKWVSNKYLDSETFYLALTYIDSIGTYSRQKKFNHWQKK